MEVELIKQNCKSHELRMLNLYLLMYADDMVLFSESIHEIQKMIDVVNLYSNEYIDLITFNNFPVIPHLTNFCHNLLCVTLSKALV
jgi:hypothetical protein